MQEKHRYFSMELKYLPDLSDRIVLWRNTIQLFRKYNKPEFIGPFFKAGLKEYRIEPRVQTKKDGKQKNPDIIASGQFGWLVLELTMNSHSKKEKLDSYSLIDPRGLGNYGLPPHNQLPDVISCRLSAVNDGNYCQIIVKDTLNVKNESFIKEINLKNALIGSNGLHLYKLPVIAISLVPEMQESTEIRRGLIDIVIQIFKPNCDGKTTYELCSDGLDKLFDLVGETERTSLMQRIKTEMDVLVKEHLNEYLEYKNDKYRATEKFKNRPLPRQVISLKLKEWAFPSGGQHTLTDYGQ